MRIIFPERALGYVFQFRPFIYFSCLPRPRLKGNSRYGLLTLLYAYSPPFSPFINNRGRSHMCAHYYCLRTLPETNPCPHVPVLRVWQKKTAEKAPPADMILVSMPLICEVSSAAPDRAGRRSFTSFGSTYRNRVRRFVGSLVASLRSTRGV